MERWDVVYEVRGQVLILFLPLTSCVVNSNTVDLGLVVVLCLGCTLESPGGCLKRKITKPHPMGILIELV